MPIAVDCYSFAKHYRVPDSAAGKPMKCPACSAVLRVPDPSNDPPIAGTRTPPPVPPGAVPVRVVVTDLDIRFVSLVWLMVKVAVASIPAAFIVLLLVLAASLAPAVIARILGST